MLNQGKLIHDGQPDEVLDYYNAIIARKEKEAEIKQIEYAYSQSTRRSGNKKAILISAEMLNTDGENTHAFVSEDITTLRCRIRYQEAVENLTVGFIIRDRLGNDVFGTNTYRLHRDIPFLALDQELVVDFKTKLNIGQGNYSVSVALHSGNTHISDNYDWWDQAAVFEVIPGNTSDFIGIAALPIEVFTEWQNSDR